MTSRHYPHLWPQNNIWGKLTVVLLLERDYSLRYLSFPTWIIGSAGFIEIHTVTMDTAISISSSLPAVPLRIVPTSSISLSSSSLLPLPRSHIKNNKFYSVRTRFWNSSSAVPKFTVICGAGITEINQSQFKDTVLKSDRPVLVEFVATWCGPCRLITPAMESIAKEYGDRLTVVKIDHDANPQLIEEYKVYGLPTLILFKNGQEVPESRREGAITKVKLKDYLDAFLESISVT